MTETGTVFDPETSPSDVPIVQLLLSDNGDSDQHYNLGGAIAPLLSENIQIIVFGKALHNLRDIKPRAIDDQSPPPSASFDKALKQVTMGRPEERQVKKSETIGEQRR